MIRQLFIAVALFATTFNVVADTPSGIEVRYLGNAGVLVQLGATKVLFDPLYRVSDERYQSVPEPLENAVLVGEPPYDGVAAIFVSHVHHNHFSPGLVLDYLMIHPEVRLFAPEQAIRTLRRFAGEGDEQSLERITAIDLPAAAPPAHYTLGPLAVTAVRIPHAEGPKPDPDLQNLAYEVTAEGVGTVIHLGDAAPRAELFERFAGQIQTGSEPVVLAPYWFFLKPEGRSILERQLHAAEVLGIHVPVEIAGQRSRRPMALRAVDLFTQPGEKRDFGMTEE